MFLVAFNSKVGDVLLPQGLKLKNTQNKL